MNKQFFWYVYVSKLDWTIIKTRIKYVMSADDVQKPMNQVETRMIDFFKQTESPKWVKLLNTKTKLQKWAKILIIIALQLLTYEQPNFYINTYWVL